MYDFQRDVTNVSYGSKENEIVTMLSTLLNGKGIESCDENKTEIIQYYNSTKGGRVDMDQKIRYYSIK